MCDIERFKEEIISRIDGLERKVERSNELIEIIRQNIAKQELVKSLIEKNKGKIIPFEEDPKNENV